MAGSIGTVQELTSRIPRPLGESMPFGHGTLSSPPIHRLLFNSQVQISVRECHRFISFAFSFGDTITLHAASVSLFTDLHPIDQVGWEMLLYGSLVVA